MFSTLKNLFNRGRSDLTSITNFERFSCGQVWSYKTRKTEKNSTLTIVRIDKDAQGEVIIHVWLDNLKIKNPNHPDGMETTFPHTPLSIAAIDSSVTRLIKTRADLPAYTEGYDIWLQAWQRGKASVFSVPIKEILDFVEQSLCATAK